MKFLKDKKNMKNLKIYKTNMKLENFNKQNFKKSENIKNLENFGTKIENHKI